MKYITHLLLIFLLPTQTLLADDTNYDIRQLALPSEVKDLGKTGGSIYYSPSVKGKVLIPVNVWGDVGRSGLHFVPVDTTLILGLSLAGGPSSHANLAEVKLNRIEKGNNTSYTFDLTKGGDLSAQAFALKPGDTVFVENDKFYENRAYYTSLIGVIATILSSVWLYREVKK